jgi:hypothetical protein
MTSPSAGRPVARCARRDHCGPKAKRSAPRLLPTAVAFVACALLVAGCSSSGSSPQLGDPASSTPAVTTPTTSAPPQPTMRAQVLAQYQGFWSHLTAASRAPAAQRRAILQPYAANPELKSLLAGIARDRTKGRVFYGAPVIHATVSLPAGVPRTAVVRDCQDATHTGDQDLKTGRRLTKGTPHTLVVSTLHSASGGHWRVAFVTFPKRSCSAD